MLREKYFDDGSSINRPNRDFDPDLQNTHYSLKPAHFERSFVNHFALVGLPPSDNQMLRLIRRKIIRSTRDSRR